MSKQKTPWFHIVCELDAQAKPAPTIRDIQRAVCGRYAGITINDILSSRRSDGVEMPRHLAMYLARTLTLKSYPQIGAAFSDRDHTTIMHGVKKIKERAQTDKPLRDMISAISTELGCGG